MAIKNLRDDAPSVTEFSALIHSGLGRALTRYEFLELHRENWDGFLMKLQALRQDDRKINLNIVAKDFRDSCLSCRKKNDDISIEDPELASILEEFAPAELIDDEGLLKTPLKAIEVRDLFYQGYQKYLEAKAREPPEDLFATDRSAKLALQVEFIIYMKWATNKQKEKQPKLTTSELCKYFLYAKDLRT